MIIIIMIIIMIISMAGGVPTTNSISMQPCTMHNIGNMSSYLYYYRSTYVYYCCNDAHFYWM